LGGNGGYGAGGNGAQVFSSPFNPLVRIDIDIDVYVYVWMYVYTHICVEGERASLLVAVQPAGEDAYRYIDVYLYA